MPKENDMNKIPVIATCLYCEGPLFKAGKRFCDEHCQRFYHKHEEEGGESG